MSQIIDVSIPSSMKPTLKDAMAYVVDRSGYTPEPAHGVVTSRKIWPAQVEHVELVESTRSLALDVHPFEQVGVPLGIENDHHFVVGRLPAPTVRPPDVLSDEELGQARFANARCA